MTLYCAQPFPAFDKPGVDLLCTRDTGHVGPHATTIGEQRYFGGERDGQNIPSDFGADCEQGTRHPKWQRVEPGTVIPAGQPYRWEYDSGDAYETKASSGGRTVPDHPHYFIDSSWKPPRVHQCCGTECTTDELASNSSLVLPTEPTWGIAVHRRFDKGWGFGRWHLDGDEFWQDCASAKFSWRPHNVLDFIPLTDEQFARIEAAR